MIKLGEKYRDIISGFTGTATAKTEFLYGCVRICIESKELKDDGVPKEVWFDEQRLEPLSAKLKAEIGPPQALSGGPRDHNPRRADK